ncbi:Transmembrane protein [Melia azedarach]|uniref:Transmembrane protein n=1 Tax=Melia azedarach TaxID=155640 RepID=A0ACC1YIQ0_MELAZ|nr:Transmembrane protein [Melia azedarach]
MALGLVYSLQNLWPFSLFKYDDLRASKELVGRLSIPEHTKEFVFAIKEPQSHSVIYILCAQNLSERSALDAESLIREVRPDAVVAQVGVVSEIQCEESELGENVDDPVPTSSFGVLKRCFIDKINKEKYENVAGNFVLKEIFGISFHGHLLAAKRAAKEVGSSFLVLESCLVRNPVADDPSGEVDAVNKVQGLVSSLIPQKVGSTVSSSSRRVCLTSDVESQMVKILSSNLDFSGWKLRSPGSNWDAGSKEVEPIGSYQVPSFAQSFYPLLVDLHDIFVDLPSMARALALSQKMFYDLSRGKFVDTQVVSEVYTFRIAVEGLRIALNNAGRLPINKLKNSNSSNFDFSDLPVEDKTHALLAQALQTQGKKFKTMVAVVDASCLAGLRKHWNTPLPHEIKDLVGDLVKSCEDDGETSNSNTKWLLSNKPVVAVGAGASAVLGASSLSKVLPASTFMKVVTFKAPASLKLFLTQTQKAMAIALGKTKVVAPGLATSGSNTSSILKAAASAEKIRAVAHSVIASIEKTSFSAMRTAFYEIMRKRRVRPIGVLPWATFGCSVATCSGLLVYGDGIECVAESFPAAPSIASLGRGIQSLHQASQAVRQTDGTRIQKSIETLMHRLKKVKVQ